MMQSNTTLAEKFYKAFGEKNIEEMERYLHHNIKLISPLATIEGKEAYLQSAKGFSSLFSSLTIRTVFGEENHAAVVYDVDCPAPIGIISGTAILTFSEGFIIRNELFHDTHPFQKIRDQFSA